MSHCVERLSELHMGTRPRPSLSIVGVDHNRSLMKVVVSSDLCSFEHKGQCCPFLFMRNSVLVVIKTPVFHKKGQSYDYILILYEYIYIFFKLCSKHCICTSWQLLLIDAYKHQYILKTLMRSQISHMKYLQSSFKTPADFLITPLR